MSMEREPIDPLDQNLERLLRVAPERERMSSAAKDRLAARLRDRGAVTPQQSPEQTPQQRPLPDPARRSWGWRIAVAAAAAVLLFLGGQAIKNSMTSPTSEDPERVAESTPATGDQRTPDGTRNRGDVDRGEQLAEGPRRAPVGPTQDSPEGPLVAAPADAAQGPLTVAGKLRLDDSLAAAPGTVTVWVRPMVPLPRVADAERYVLPWTGTRSLPFQLTEALGPARRMDAGRVLIHVEAPGAGSTSAIHTLTDDGLAGVALTLSAQESATGFVVDEETKVGIAGAIVIAVDQIPFDALDVHPEKQGELPATHAVTDATGRFTLRGLRRAKSVRLRASAPGFGPGWQTILASPGAEDTDAPRFDGTLELGPGGRVFGVVEREDGTRWPAAAIIVSRQDFDPATITRPVLTYGSALTDADGRFEVVDLPSGMYVTLLMGEIRGGSNVVPKAFELTRVKAGEDTEINFMSVQASAGGALRGILRSAEGTPLAGRSLTLSVTSASSQEDSGWRATTTLSDGTFTFADLDPGHHTLLHTLGGFAEMAAIWAGPIDGPTEVDVSLPGGAVLLERAPTSTDVGPGDGGAGEQGAWAMVERLDQASGQWNFAGSGFQARGMSVLIRHLLPGRYRATYLCDEPGDAFALAGPFDVLETQLVVPITVPPGDALTVKAAGRNGVPIEGLEVEVRPLAPSPWAGRRLPQQATPITGSDGLAQLRGVPFGELEIRVRLDGKTVGSRRLSYRKGGPGSEKEPAELVLE